MKSLSDFKIKFSETGLWKFLLHHAQRLGHKAIYSALLMYNAYRQPHTPYWAKSIILGALGYLLTPIDALPDLTPVLGFTDDLGILSFGLVTIACYVDGGIREASKAKLYTWFKQVNEADLHQIDRKL